MADLYHYWGNDLAVAASGDLLTAEPPERTRQAVLRRLMTSPADMLFHQEYGAGLPGRVGGVGDVAGIAGVVRAQMFMEPGVAHSPEPSVSVAPIPKGMSIGISYADNDTAGLQTLAFDLKN